MNEITTLIQNIGFPIVMALLLYKKSVDTDIKNTEAINNNTQILNQLMEIMRGNNDEKGD